MSGGLIAKRGVQRLVATSQKNIYVPLKTPATNAAWEGLTHTTSPMAKLEMRALFGVPDNAAAVDLQIYVKDTGSFATRCYMAVSPLPVGNPISVECGGIANNFFVSQKFLCPCDDYGDIYWSCLSSGASSLTVYMRCWGWVGGHF